MKLIFVVGAIFFYISCSNMVKDKNDQAIIATNDTLIKADLLPALINNNNARVKIIIHDTLPSINIDTSKASAESIVRFAETLIGIPYKYGSTDPANGFDFSGFITYVFNHFNIKVPRSSIDFTNVGTAISLKDAERGDIILFTGTDSTEKFIGHMGIITVKVNDSVQFIHSTSGKAYGVTVTPLNDFYKGRFVKMIRLFKP